jgi:membrane-associated phospholipid phosphatase
MRADEALHFNWLGWYDVVATHRSIQLVERAFYGSVFVTPLVLAAYFAYFRERARAHLFIASYWLAVVVTLALFAFFPAKGPFAVSAHGIIPYMPKSGFDQAVIIEGLKQQKIHDVPLQALHGLVSFPSFHTAAAVLYILAAWPIARLRWPVLIVNLLMLASIPVEGTHYLTDMIAGALVGASAYATMSFLLRRPASGQPSRSATARLPGSSGHFR